MRRIVVIVFLFISAASAYRYLVSHIHFKEGFPLRFDRTVHNFGKVAWGNPVEAKFRFLNASQQEVAIEHITTSCACAVAYLSSHRFRSGEQGILTVRFLPTGFVGQVTQTLQIYLKGFRNPVNLHLKADVNPLLMPSPSKIDFGLISPQRQVSTMLVIKNTSGRKVRITRIETSREYVKAFVLKDGDEPLIRVSLVHPPVGKVYDRLYIYTSLPERSIIDQSALSLMCLSRLRSPASGN